MTFVSLEMERFFLDPAMAERMPASRTKELAPAAQAQQKRGARLGYAVCSPTNACLNDGGARTAEGRGSFAVRGRVKDLR